MAEKIYLEFEKPIAELEAAINSGHLVVPSELITLFAETPS